jgi:hypothetical protein
MKQQAHFARNRCKHVRRGDPARDQRRHSPQRGLLVRQPSKLFATRSVNSASRYSSRSGSGAGSVVRTEIAPQTSPSTTIGAPAHERNPAARWACAIVPSTPTKSSRRPGRPVFLRSAQIAPPSSGQLLPVWNGCGQSLQAPMMVPVPSAS